MMLKKLSLMMVVMAVFFSGVLSVSAAPPQVSNQRVENSFTAVAADYAYDDSQYQPQFRAAVARAAAKASRAVARSARRAAGHVADAGRFVYHNRWPLLEGATDVIDRASLIGYAPIDVPSGDRIAVLDRAFDY